MIFVCIKRHPIYNSPQPKQTYSKMYRRIQIFINDRARRKDASKVGAIKNIVFEMALHFIAISRLVLASRSPTGPRRFRIFYLVLHGP